MFFFKISLGSVPKVRQALNQNFYDVFKIILVRIVRQALEGGGGQRFVAANTKKKFFIQKV